MQKVQVLLHDLDNLDKTIEQNNILRAMSLKIELANRYKEKIDDIEIYLDDDMDYMSSLIGLREELRKYLSNIFNENEESKSQTGCVVHICNNNSSNNNVNNTQSNTNSNANTNTINVELLFEEAKKQINENDSLSDENIAEILSKINELENLYKSDKNSRSKWSKAKEILTWLLDQGVQVATKILPLITETIK